LRVYRKSELCLNTQSAPLKRKLADEEVQTRVEQLSDQLQTVSLVRNRASKQTALVLEKNSFKRPDPSEEAIEQVAQVLSTPQRQATTATTGDNVCSYCQTAFTSARGVQVHLWKAKICKAKALADKDN
jgi:hypothetical protein